MKPFDAAGEFSPVSDGADLRRVAVRGAGVAIFSQGLGIAVQMIATVVLARLLTPTDYGVVTMVTTFSLLFMNFGLNGFIEAVVQRERMTRALANNLFWINLGAGFLLTLAFAASGSLLAAFFHSPLVDHVAIGFSFTIILTSISVLHLALLKRAMRFTSLAANELISRCVMVGVSIWLGWAGWGYWALVGGAIAQALSTSVGGWILCRWVPGVPRRTEGTAEMVRFAMNVYGFFGLHYAKSNLDNLLVGCSLGPDALGLYKRAYDLFRLPSNSLLNPLSNAAAPTLCRLTNEPDRYRRYLLQSFSILAFAGMGVAAVLTLSGREVTLILLGPKWSETGRILTVFGPGIGAMFLYAPWGWIPLSIGRADRYFRWGVIELTVTAALFLLALPRGPMGIAAAWSVSYWLLVLPATWYAGRPIGFGIGPVVQVIWRYILAAGLAGLACALTMGRMPALMSLPGEIGASARIIVICLIFGSLYLGACVVLHGGLEPFRQITRLLPDLKPRARTQPQMPLAPAVNEAVPAPDAYGVSGLALSNLGDVCGDARAQGEFNRAPVATAYVETDDDRVPGFSDDSLLKR